MSSDTPQELRPQNIVTSVSRPHGSLRGNAVATSSKTLTLEPYFWWTKKEFAWDIASHPWKEPAGNEETADLELEQYLLRDIRTTAGAQKNRYAPWTPEEWSATVNKAVQTVSGQSKWSEYKVKLLPITTKKPTDPMSPVRQNETWRKELAEMGSEVGHACALLGFPDGEFAFELFPWDDSNLVRPMLKKLYNEWFEGASFRERLTLVDSFCELDGPSRDAENSDYWTSRLVRACGDSIIEDNLDIIVFRGPPPRQRPRPSWHDDPDPPSLLLFGGPLANR